jgi:FemAB-related protein (PEP-CTERM system-associated)
MQASMSSQPDFQSQAAPAAAGSTVTTLNADVDRERWNRFVFEHPEGTFFHRVEWEGLVRRAFGHRAHYLFAERDGRICGVLPLIEVKSALFGHSLVSTPFCVYGGILALDAEAHAALEGKACALARELNVDYLEMRNRKRSHPGWPSKDLYVTFRRPIDADSEKNMLAIPRKQRAMVRKGIKNGLVSHIDANVDRFFDLYADNVHRHGTPAMPKRYFQALMRKFGADCEVLTVTAPDGRPLSSVLSFYFRDEVLPYYAGDDEEARDLAANDFKYWELMRRACARGLKVFDYGRSKQGTGSYSFKKNWGFEPTPLHYEYCLYKRDAIPQNNPSNAKYRLLIETWRRMPIGLANWLGPFIVRTLG